MNKIRTCLLFTLIASLAFAKGTPEEVRASQMRVFGGMVPDRRAQKGEIVVVNAQKAASDALLNAAVRGFTEKVLIAIRIADGSFDIKSPEVKGQASLFVVDEPSLPMSLIAPEAKWALVNVAPLKSDKAAFFEARVKKETFRALAYLSGVGASKYPTCITQCVTSVEDLDSIPDIKCPLEFTPRFETYLPKYGIVPYRMERYGRAVQQGWAPQPTNEFQKAIWEKVHSIPTKPIKIEYDPKTDTK